MPLPVLNYAALQPSGNPFQENLMKSIQQGMFGIPMSQAELQKQQLANQLAAIQNQYAPQMTQAQLATEQARGPYMQAQTGLTNEQARYFGPEALAKIGLENQQARLAGTQANLPFGGHFFPGVAGDVQGLEAVKQLFGENSPQYKQALDAFNLSQQSTQSRVNYQNVLSQTLPVRTLTNTGKNILEQSNVEAGNMPTGQPWGGISNNLGQPTPTGDMRQDLTNSINSAMASASGTPSANRAPAAPASPQDLGNQYALGRQKINTDADTRKRNLYATNIEKTLNNINVDDLTQYSGLLGTLEKSGQQGLAAFGKESAAYDKFQKNLVAADFLASQVRQFYGESIQPAMREKLEALSNPSTWANNPKLAKAMFEQTKNILGQEMKTYRDALQTTSAYQEQGGQQSQSQSTQVRRYNPETRRIE